MIKRIVLFSLLGLLVISLFLFFAGIRESNFNTESLNVFLKSLSTRFNSWSFRIPKIPTINTAKLISTAQETTVIGVLLRTFFTLVLMFNFLIQLLNLIVVLLNVLIAVLGGIVSFIGAIKDWLSFLGATSFVRLL